MNAAEIPSLLRQTVVEWWHDDALHLGAALSYYTVFSIAPILVVSVAVAGLFFGADAASGRIVDEMKGLMGAQGASIIQTLIERASFHPRAGWVATAIGVATIVVGASGAFGELQYALNKVWDAPAPERAGWLTAARKRLVSFGMVLAIGFLLLVSLVISAALSALDTLAGGWGERVQPLLALANLAASFGIATALFAGLFKILPDVSVRWRDVWAGAAATAALFVVGKALIGLYLGNSGVTSMYGAAGSLVVVLIWVYYSAQILFLGAEFTQVLAKRRREVRHAAR
jgi:membrane protein